MTYTYDNCVDSASMHTWLASHVLLSGKEIHGFNNVEVTENERVFFHVNVSVITAAVGGMSIYIVGKVSNSYTSCV